jgi:dTDP-4-dehydrorhamnose 3,5-epimerase-like enzyme
MNHKLINIKTVKTENKGSLSFFEATRDIPFEIRRVYYIHGVDAGIERGGHAHKTLEQFLFCPFGSIEIIIDDGINEKQTILLNDPSVGFYVPIYMWLEMVWREKNSVLCVVASDYYDENEYIRDYDEFMKQVSDRKA